jgi:putative transposase
MKRTVRLPLILTEGQKTVLLETSHQFTESFNRVCSFAWASQEKNGVRLHHSTYRSLKDEFPDLVSDHHVQARVKATEAIRSAFALKRMGKKVSCPRSSGCSVRYDRHTFKIDWPSRTVKLSTTGGRIIVGFVVPDFFSWAERGEARSSELVIRGDRFWLHVTVETETPSVEHSDVVVGVDLGVNRPAVTSDAGFLGKRHWKDIENRMFRQTRQCQSKGTKSSRRRLRILRGRRNRFRRDCDHVISRQIVEGVDQGGTVVLENLANIRSSVKAKKRHGRRLHEWSFDQLKSFVTYKAELVGVRVVLIDPRHTSQTCSSCGHKAKSNRRSQSLFCCRSCGFTLNADLNAARNIRAKHLGTFGKSLGVRPLSEGPTSLETQCGGSKDAACKLIDPSINV